MITMVYPKSTSVKRREFSLHQPLHSLSAICRRIPHKREYRMKPIRLLCLLTALLLALCLPAQAESSLISRSRESHLLLKDMNVGPCTALTGQVEVMVIFVDVGDTGWAASDMLAMQQELQSAADQLCREAAAYGAALRIRLN